MAGWGYCPVEGGSVVSARAGLGPGASVKRMLLVASVEGLSEVQGGASITVHSHDASLRQTPRHTDIEGQPAPRDQTDSHSRAARASSSKRSSSQLAGPSGRSTASPCRRCE